MAVRFDEAAQRIDLGVRDLLPAEDTDPFAPARGGFARLLAGVRAHESYGEAATAVDPAYQREVFVRGQFEVDGWAVHVSGRVDGLRREGTETVVEEVKSVVLSDEAFAAVDAAGYPDYLTQLRQYLLIIARQAVDAPVALSGRLVFVNLPAGTVRTFVIPCDHPASERLLVERVRALIGAWRDREKGLQRRRQRADSIRFPHPERRRFQREMEDACRRALDAGECLLVSAPPGLGKTAAALMAAVEHALRNDRRVFFATSKTTEQRLVARTLARLAASEPALTSVVLQAKAKICTNDVVFCHPEMCEFARDYPSKVATSGVRERLLALPVARPEEVRQAGLETRACPFELSLELSACADVVVGDYNYVFDPSVALDQLFEDGGAASLVLIIDEAHNLLDRARGYYSPSLDSGEVRRLMAAIEGRPGEMYRALEGWLDGLLRWFSRLLGDVADEQPLPGSPPCFVVWSEVESIRARRAALDPILLTYLAFRRACKSAVPEDPILDLAFGFLRFARVMDLGERTASGEFAYLLEPREGGDATYRIVCLDPARQLARRLGSFHGVIAMSATLAPEAYYRDLLGFPPGRTGSVTFASPFARENRRILVVPTVSTTYRERYLWYDQVATTLGELVETHAGHWVAFLPSFAYLREVEARLVGLGGELLVQEPLMDERARNEILQRLEQPDGSSRLLLAVLGGIFAEGVDLPGDALVGVVVVSPGLPAVSRERELLRDRMEAEHGAGFEYAYVVPGINRVIQAAGRLVRSERDRGVVVLFDRRFATPTYARYFPRDWYVKSPMELVTRDPVAAIRGFFAADG